MRPPPVRKPRLSLLAVFGVILAAFACCPPANLIGSVLGAMALQRIAVSNGALRGRRLARTAMLLGLCFSIAGAIGWWRIMDGMQRWTNETAITQVRTFIVAAQQADHAGARSAWTTASNARLTEDSIINFGRLSGERYGALRDVNVTSIAANGGLLATSFDIACNFSFENGDRLGSVGFALEPSTGFRMPHMRLRQITIDDGEHGDLTLPGAVSSGSRSGTQPSATAPGGAGG